MNDSDLTQPGTKVDAKLWQRFRDHVETTRGGVRGHLRSELETALREYMAAYEGGDTVDRLRRIEDRLDEVADAVAESDSDGGTDSVSKTTENRIADIMADVQRRADELDTNRVRESDVEASIERNAGTSYKTIQRYKRLLQNQRELFPDPLSDDVFYVNEVAFVLRVENAVPNDEADEIRKTYGREWYDEIVEQVQPDGEERAFQ
jgi:hypothetical protein